MAGRSIKFVCGVPAARIGGVLAVADLHMGIEEKYATKGIRLADASVRIADALCSLVAREKPKTLVVVGDVKHEIAGAAHGWTAQLRALFESLASSCEVIVARGNHDGMLAEMLAGVRGVTVAGAGGFALGKTGFAHGHAWPSEEVMGAQQVLCGHMHPSVEVISPRGEKSVERAWVVAHAEPDALLARYPHANPALRLVAMPAFNPLAGGAPLNRPGTPERKRPAMSGIFKWANGEVYLLDGVRLGSVSALSGGSGGRKNER